MRARLWVKVMTFALLASLSTVITPSAHAAPGESDTFLNLDGTARYATIASNSALGTMNAISIEFWFKSSAATCSGNIVAKGVDYAVYCASGILNFAFKGGGTVTGTPIRYSSSSGPTYLTVPQDEWHHFAITRAANTATVTTYWDGQIVSSDQSADGAGTTALQNSGEVFNIGARRNATTYFNGGIDEVRISNVVRTQSEIQRNMHQWGIGSQTGVVAYFDFNDISGNSLTDRVGSNNMTLVGSPTISSVESTTQSNGDTVVTFPRSYLTSQGGWKVPAGVTKMESLVVAGGGAGGSRAGGGGGAGGYVATALNTLTFTPGAVETITVGQGGVGQNNWRGSNGQNSALGNRRIALGGGSGGSANGGDNAPRNGADGGSGGGAATGFAGLTVGLAKQNANYGYGLGSDGALALGAAYYPGGGGGGSSSAALVATSSSATTWSSGGNGTSNSISGNPICYSTGGGGGFGYSTVGGPSTMLKSNGGNCGGAANPNGGRGSYGKLAAEWGAPNTGAGGGGTGFDDSVTGADQPGGSGGSGVIVLRYLSTLTATFTGVTTATYRQSSSISVTASLASKVTFLANGKRIAGCISLLTNSSLVATCSWRPSIRGTITLTATVTPLLPGVSAQSKSVIANVARRSGSR